MSIYAVYSERIGVTMDSVKPPVSIRLPDLTHRLSIRDARDLLTALTVILSEFDKERS